MTSAVDLRELSIRESEQTEWKENVADLEDVVATLVAFANDLQNLGGGYVVCGAREAKDAHGFPKLVQAGLTAERFKEIENHALALCRSHVSPPITPRVEELAAETPDRRVLVFVQPATSDAHSFRRRGESGKYFVRISRSTIEARNGTLRELLVRKGAAEPWDRRPCAAATVNDLDLLALRDALQRMGVFTLDRGVEPYLKDGVQLSPFVPSLCAAEPLTGVLRPRNFAILLFGREPQRFVPGAYAVHSVYPGLDRSDPYAKRHEIAGSLIDQARRLQGLLDAEAVTLFDKTNLREPNAEKYPRRALQEAMVNALAHRDYAMVEPSRFTSFADRIEVVSPGALPLGVSLADLRKSVVTPRWRNQSLAWFLSRLQLAQAEGQGISTIRRSLKEAGSPEPVFDATEATVSCTLPAHPRFRSLGAPRKKRKKVATKKKSATKKKATTPKKKKKKRA